MPARDHVTTSPPSPHHLPTDHLAAHCASFNTRHDHLCSTGHHEATKLASSPHVLEIPRSSPMIEAWRILLRISGHSNESLSRPDAGHQIFRGCAFPRSEQLRVETRTRFQLICPRLAVSPDYNAFETTSLEWMPFPARLDNIDGRGSPIFAQPRVVSTRRSGSQSFLCHLGPTNQPSSQADPVTKPPWA